MGTVSSKMIKVSEEEFQGALNYFYRKASVEVKQFNSNECYGNISSEKNDILYYTGRILPCQQINAITTMSNTMRYLTRTSFCVPLVDKYSPLAFSIVNEWYHSVAKHSGVETVLRYSMQHAYIFEGRDIVKKIKKSCERCKILMNMTFNVSM